jgi:hypothetical protein
VYYEDKQRRMEYRMVHRLDGVIGFKVSTVTAGRDKQEFSKQTMVISAL